MISKSTPKILEMPRATAVVSAMQHVGTSMWPLIALVSLAAGIGSGWRVLFLRSDLLTPTTSAELLSPLTATATMVIATFAGWYVWGFFIHYCDKALFGGHSTYSGTLNAFARAYVFQVLFLLTFTRPLGWLWGWIALYATVAAWGIIGPRQLGMRTWQAVVSASAGMLMWMACLVLMNVTLMTDGVSFGIGAFLV
jgi:hypothetical protein